MVNEARILKMLGSRGNSVNQQLTTDKVGFPKLHWYGREGDYNLMVLELLGDNLEDLMKSMSHNSRRFSLLTVLNVAD